VQFPAVPTEDSWLVVGTEGPLWRLSRRDGSVIWKEKLPASARSAPILLDSLVVVATDVPRGQVVAYRYRDGEEVWSWGRGLTLPAARDTALVLAVRGGGALRLHTGHGGEEWQHELPGAGWTPPALRLEEGLVLVPVRPDSLFALSLADGETVWAVNVGGWAFVSEEEGPLYVAASDSTLRLLDPATGEETRHLDLGALPSGSPVVRNGVVYLSLRNGALLALDGEDLGTLWRRRFDPPLVAPPTVRGGLLFQAGDLGKVYMVDVHTGAVVGEYGHRELVVSSPAYASEEIAVGGNRGTLIVFRRNP
jgi:outer membrane protein assembly factor BamB